jgi:hypothetical protein
MRIYIEGTIPSYVAARPARDLLQAARQHITRDWWDLKRAEHELFTSQVALDEISAGEAEMARHRQAIMAGIALLDMTDTAEELADHILTSGLLPASADGDAAHIALATAHGMDALLTWNCRHIANVGIQGRLRGLVESQGYELPVICTPEEFLGELYD